jgi:hypothetical protein
MHHQDYDFRDQPLALFEVYNYTSEPQATDLQELPCPPQHEHQPDAGIPCDGIAQLLSSSLELPNLLDQYQPASFPTL